MLIAVVGKPNSGKTTFFSALTMVDAKIANFPFTTIQPNMGVGYVRKKCPHIEINKQCNPKDSVCTDGTRFIPVELIDVAGIVPDAHKGRGLGLQFLDDIRRAEGFIQVVDGSGKTDMEGNPSEEGDVVEEVLFLEKEMVHWIDSILERNWQKIKGRDVKEIAQTFSGLNVKKEDVEQVVKKCGLKEENIQWDATEKMMFAKELMKLKSTVIAVNKLDLPGAEENLERLKRTFPEKTVIGCYGMIEYALKRANRSGVIKYIPGENKFDVVSQNEKQKEALIKFEKLLSKKDTGVQRALETIVFNLLSYISVYPVEDENGWCDKHGNVLPNVFLVKKHSHLKDVAERVHTDFAKHFIGAIDCRKRVHLSKDYIINDGDVIKILVGRG